jgi:4-amino-4-deoxy-L-arabinose transferase-like glycosyltransferase
MPTKPPRIIETLIVLFAFTLPLVVGRWGVFAYDQSLVFDGGYRILSGQVPHKDFFIPFPALCLYIQSFAFQLFGISYWSFVLPAAAMNAIATVCTIHIIKGLFPGLQWIGSVGGLMTAVFYYSIFGTTYPELTAFFFLFLAMSLLTFAGKNGHSNPWQGGGVYFWVGVCGALCLLCKQNAGILGIPLLFTLFCFCYQLWQTGQWRCQPVFYFMSGVAVPLAAYATWVHNFSDWDAFQRYVFEIPREEGARRISGQAPLHLISELIKGKGNDAICIMNISWVVYLATFILFSHKNNLTSDQTFRLAIKASVLSIALVIFQNTFSLVSANNGINEKPFTGIYVATVSGILFYLRQLSTANSKTKPLGKNYTYALLIASGVLTSASGNGDHIAGALIGLLLALSSGMTKFRDRDTEKSGGQAMLAMVLNAVFYTFLLGTSLHAAISRNVHSTFDLDSGITPEFKDQIQARKLRGLRWGNPTMVHGYNVTSQEVNQLLDYLRTEGGNFWIFPDHTFLHAAGGVPSPQPILWFHKGLTYPNQYDPDLDQTIVNSLKKNHVRFIVVERPPGSLRSPGILNDFPLLEDYLTKHYRKTAKFGMFEIFYSP